MHAVDVKYPLLIAATADKKITIFHLDNPSKPYRVRIACVDYTCLRCAWLMRNVVAILHRIRDTLAIRFRSAYIPMVGNGITTQVQRPDTQSVSRQAVIRTQLVGRSHRDSLR